MPDDLVADLPPGDAEALVTLVQQGIPGGLAPGQERRATVAAEALADLQGGKLGEHRWTESVGAKGPGGEGVLLEGIIEAPGEGPARLVLENAVVERVWVDGAVQPETVPTLRKGSSRVVVWVVPTGSGAVRWRLAKP